MWKALVSTRFAPDFYRWKYKFLIISKLNNGPRFAYLRPTGRLVANIASTRRLLLNKISGVSCLFLSIGWVADDGW